MKILKNVLAGIGILMILIATVVIIFFCGFAAGMDFKDNAEKKIDEILNKNNKTNSDKYKKISFIDVKDATDVLNKMNEVLEEYGVVSVADMRELAGTPSDNYEDNKYGWFNLRGAKVTTNYNSDGFILHLPKPVRID